MTGKYIIHLIGKDSKPGNYPKSSEYIKPLGKINITSHGLGSGIYGLSSKSLKSQFKNLPPYLKSGTQIKLYISNPLILHTPESCDKLISWSTSLNNYLHYRKNVLSQNNNLERANLLKHIAVMFVKPFNNISHIKITKKKFINSIKQFFQEYVSRKNYVHMPINYILQSLQYNGIYSENTFCDTMTKGNVKFIPYPDKVNNTITDTVKIRSGTSVKVLKIPNFIKIKNTLLKHPSKTKEFKKYIQWKIKRNIPLTWSETRKLLRNSKINTSESSEYIRRKIINNTITPLDINKLIHNYK